MVNIGQSFNRGQKPDLDHECNICLEAILPQDLIGFINSCCTTKYYHKSCIVQWSQNSNSCPQCRRRFYVITIALFSNPHLVIDTVPIQDKLLPNPAVDEIPQEFIISRNDLVDDNFEVSSNGVCSICSSSDYRSSIRNMINCNFCGCNFHLNCLGLTGAEPYINWCCPFCDCDQNLILPLPTIQTSSRGRRGGRGMIRPNPIPRQNRRINLIDHDVNHQANFSTPPRRPGLIIHNSNNELDDSFLYQQEFNDDQNLPLHSNHVINGGVLLRKELKAKKNLTEEEKQSWDGYEKLREGVEVVEPNATTSDNHDSKKRTRRRRKKITPIETRELKQDQTIEGCSKTSSNSSRISSLINQLKTSSNKYSSNQFPPPQSINNLSDSPTSLSPSSNSLNEYSGESDTQYDSDSKIIKKSRNELTLDHKIEIQKYIRNNLRPLYKIDSNSFPVIHTEDEYIKINKTASHKIYQHILDGGNRDLNFIDQTFNEPHHIILKQIVDKYVQEELKGLKE